MSTYSVQSISIPSSGGWELPGEFYRPATTRANGKAVLLLHQLRKDRHDWDALAVQLADEGYSVLAVDARGHGKSTIAKHSNPGTTPKIEHHAKSWESFDEKAGDFLGLIDDANAALSHLRRSLPGDKIVVVGSSVGGNCAVLLASKMASEQTPLAGIALLSAGYNYRGVDCRHAVATVGCKAFIAASKEDGYAFHCSEKMASTIPGSTWVPLENAGHGVAMFESRDLNARLVAWLASA